MSTPSNGFYKVYIDNQATVNWINEKEEIDVKCYMFDLVKYLKNNINKLHMHGTWEWIPAHTEENDTPSIINAQADRVAKETRNEKTLCPTWRSSLQYDGVIFYKGLPILNTGMLFSIMEKESTMEYLKHKWPWEESTSNEIDWAAYRDVMEK